MLDKALHGDVLKLVRYKILFVKRDYEYAFPEQEELVYDNMDGNAFTAWKIAEFFQNLEAFNLPIPPNWGNYPPERYRKPCPTYTDKDRKCLRGLPHEDKKYLRVYYEVLDRYPREKFRYEEQQIEVLKEIRDCICRNSGSGYVPPSGESGPPPTATAPPSDGPGPPPAATAPPPGEPGPEPAEPTPPPAEPSPQQGGPTKQSRRTPKKRR